MELETQQQVEPLQAQRASSEVQKPLKATLETGPPGKAATLETGPLALETGPPERAATLETEPPERAATLELPRPHADTGHQR